MNPIICLFGSVTIIAGGIIIRDKKVSVGYINVTNKLAILVGLSITLAGITTIISAFQPPNSANILVFISVAIVTIGALIAIIVKGLF
ncbi:MAG: hypothetical protein K8L91_21335 [Anaerolineae bacterium]|nr:hypothetical protein [Anaerolineae bacterium]